MDIYKILEEGLLKNVSDLFIVADSPLCFKIGKTIIPYNTTKLMPQDTYDLIKDLYMHCTRDMQTFLATGDDDFSFSLPSIGHFRMNAYKQRGSLSAVIRLVKFQVPDYKKLHIPNSIMKLYQKKKGLVLVTGPAGSGKSTTLACLIDQINHYRNCHVITLEDPIEYTHRHEKSIISQREIPSDTQTYIKGLRAALRECPEVILVGEMRDFETMQVAMTAAETGQLIFSTLHTIGAAQTIDRIIDSFPANQQQQIRLQLSMTLTAIISQQLIPSLEGNLIPAFEILHITPAVSTMIRESKVHQLSTVLYGTKEDGMISMDTSLLALYEKGIISADDARKHSINFEYVNKKINA